MAEITPDLIVLENDIPVFNPAAKLIKEFKAVIERDKGSLGDSQGRKKLQATKELAFVALYVSLKSPYNRNFDEQARVGELVRGLELPPDWRLDEVMKKAMKRYELTQVTPSSAMIVSVRKALYSSRNIISFLEKRLEKTMKALMEAELLGDEVDALMDKAIKDVEKILECAAKLTKQLADLDILEKKYVKEMEEMKGKAQQEVNPQELED